MLVPRRGLCADPDSCAVVSMCIIAMPVRVSAHVSVQEAAQTFVQTVADFLVAPALFGVSVALGRPDWDSLRQKVHSLSKAKKARKRLDLHFQTPVLAQHLPQP